MTETIGERLKVLRERKGWSQRKLGMRSETSGSYVSLLESHKLLRPSVERMGRLARALGVTLEELAGSSEGGAVKGDVPREPDPDVVPTTALSPVISSIHATLEAIGALDPDELHLISQVLDLRLRKLEQSGR
jgi:transcriptional regulator with XRE-family HTH domain